MIRVGSLYRFVQGHPTGPPQTPLGRRYLASPEQELDGCWLTNDEMLK